MCNPRILLFVCLPLQAMEFTKDTVYETEIKGTKDETFLRNPSTDSVFIDSIYLRFSSRGVPFAEANFSADPVILPPSTITERSYQIFYDTNNAPQSDRGYSNNYSRQKIRISPVNQVKLSNFKMASCLACPTGQGGGSAAKDTVTFFIIFTAHTGEKDTLTVIGIYNRISTGLAPFPNGGYPLINNRPQEGFNALGQSLFQWKSSRSEEKQMTFSLPTNVHSDNLH